MEMYEDAQNVLLDKRKKALFTAMEKYCREDTAVAFAAERTAACF